jgi:Helicase conserved C-terminal domain/Type III restriction enzyme, res subunit
MSQIGINPKLDDLQFQKKITLKREYRGYKYDAKLGDIKERTNTICKRSNFFELSPHQEFVKRFISFDTPYNGLLLFHGLGSGKTCSAIGITEALRSFYVNNPNHKKILIVASPKLQKNYSLQLFDPDKLVKENGIWNLSGCVGSQLLSELNINPSTLNRLSKDDLVSQIEKIIKDNYSFMGYSKFSNHIYNIIHSKNSLRKLKEEFEGRVVVIDEFHNIRAEDLGSTDIKQKTASLLNTLVDNVSGMKLIFLTGTPMYNNSLEIVFLLNILNKNDGRPPIQKKEIREMFDKDNNLTERGKEILIKYSNGYVSFVRGENPYAFPYMVTPKMFNDPNSYQLLEDKPTEQFNGNEIEVPIQHIDLYMGNTSEIQERAYNKIMTQISDKFSDRDFNQIESLGYNELIKPIQSLIITYPTEEDTYISGDEGLKYAMDFKTGTVSQEFRYRAGPLDGMFKYDRIGDYSSKIRSILDKIINSKGIVLVYSQYVYGGIIPLALALEELGFKRNETGRGRSLFKDKKKDINVFNLNGKSTTTKSLPAKYAIISGNASISPDNDAEIKTLTSNNNKNGELIKVVLITEAGTEGIDMKNLRQIHIMEPWYNLNRLEQVIGRARRNCSHTDLPIEERNFDLYLHSSRLSDPNIETVDTMLYRIAEIKSIKMGQVTRVLKSVAVDCLLNMKQQSYADLTDVVKIKLSNGSEIDYSVKDEPFSSLCDYMETCKYSCVNKLENLSTIDSSTYSYKNTKNNKIIDKVKYLFTKRHVYHHKEIMTFIKTATTSNEEIDRMLFEIVDSKIPVIDKFDKSGYIIRISNLFLFQPYELTDPHLTVHERMVPVTLKTKDFLVDKLKEVPEEKVENKNQKSSREKLAETNKEMDELEKLYEKSNKSVDMSAKDEDWYSLFNDVKKYMLKMNVSESMLDKFLISHLCDQLVITDELSIINFLFSREENLNPFERKIYEHYNKLVFEKEDKKYIGLIDVVSKKEVMVLYVLHPEFIGVSKEIWKKATLIERESVTIPYKKPNVSLSKIIGVMGFFKTNFQFKTLEIDGTKRSSTGALVENKGKTELIKILNYILGKDYYTNENTKGYSKTFLAIVCELYLRYFNETKPNRLFLSKTDFYMWRN